MSHRPALAAPFLAAVLLTATAVPALAQVAVADAWVRGTVEGQRATGAFMTLTAPADTALVAVASPVAKIVEIHEMAMENNVMTMRAVPKLPLPSGKPVVLKPGGYHVMLMALQRPLKDGEAVPITLTFEGKDGSRKTQEIKATVRPLTTQASDHRKP